MSMFSLGIYKCQWCTNKILLELDAGGSHALDLFLRRQKKQSPTLCFPFPSKIKAVVEQ